LADLRLESERAETRRVQRGQPLLLAEHSVDSFNEPMTPSPSGYPFAMLTTASLRATGSLREPWRKRDIVFEHGRSAVARLAGGSVSRRVRLHGKPIIDADMPWP
jgi:hypothetical protein